MSETATEPAGDTAAPVGDVVAAFLEACGIELAFGVISIHNMPVLDAIARRGRIRFVPARGEAGAASMADAAARVSGIPGVLVTSTGTGCGNAAGALIEAQTAGTPLLHLTGQIDSDYLDRQMGFIHEAKDQPGLLAAVSKAAFRVRDPREIVSVLREAMLAATSAPTGPVSVEIPIDVQKARVAWPADLAPLAPQPRAPDPAAIEAAAARLAEADRPLIWAGGGARHCREPLERLLDLGFGLVTSTQGRGVIPESDPRSLGAFNALPAAEALYATCDAMVAVGTRLRSNETLRYRLALPGPRVRIDADPAADGRGYDSDVFVCADARLALEALAAALPPRDAGAGTLHADLTAARVAAENALRAGLAPYGPLVDAVQGAIGDGPWVRDVTISNSMWGNRLPMLRSPRQGVHALGGGIGQSLAMGIGASLATKDERALVLTGDGGLQLGLAELATAVEERAALTLVVMNSGGYAVIRNIQEAHYGGRHHYVDLLTPDFAQLAGAVGMPFQRVSSMDGAAAALGRAAEQEGPAMVEVDMGAVGDFASRFAGPPVRSAG